VGDDGGDFGVEVVGVFDFNKGKARGFGVGVKIRAGDQAVLDERFGFATFGQAFAEDVVGGAMNEKRADNGVGIMPFLCHGRAEIAHSGGDQDHDPHGVVVLECVLQIRAAGAVARFADVRGPHEFVAVFHGGEGFVCDVQEIAGEVARARAARGDGHKRSRVLQLVDERFFNAGLAGARSTTEADDHTKGMINGLRTICYTPAMLTLLIFLVVLSVLVLVHEAGHYLAARLFGVKADEFGYGLPPRAFGVVRVGKKWKWVGAKDRKEYANTIWSVNWLPIGGFVRIKGEQGEGGMDTDSFHVKPIWQRVIILAAGVAMNWALAVVLLSIGLMVGAPAVVEGLPEGAIVDSREVTIVDVLPDSPAAQAGLQVGDVVVSVDGTALENVTDTQGAIGAQGEQSFAMMVRRGGEEVALDVTAAYVPEVDKTAIGIALIDTGIVRYPFFKAIQGGVILTWEYTRLVVLTFADLIHELFNGKTETAGQLTGPVGIAVTTGQMARQGFVALMQFTAILSINLAVVNFLPIPALDGGRVLFLIFEAIRRKAMDRRTEAVIHNVAFLILIVLILFVTLRDIGRYGSVIWGGLKGLVGM